MKILFFVLLFWTLVEIEMPAANAAERTSCSVRKGGCVGGKCGIRRPFIRR